MKAIARANRKSPASPSVCLCVCLFTFGTRTEGKHRIIITINKDACAACDSLGVVHVTTEIGFGAIELRRTIAMASSSSSLLQWLCVAKKAIAFERAEPSNCDPMRQQIACALVACALVVCVLRCSCVQLPPPTPLTHSDWCLSMAIIAKISTQTKASASNGIGSDLSGSKLRSGALPARAKLSHRNRR